MPEAIQKRRAEVFKLEGDRLAFEKRFTAAIPKYLQAIKFDPSSGSYWNNLAWCYEKLHELENCKRAAERCIETEPGFIKGYIRLARAELELRDYDGALETIQRGMRQSPKHRDLIRLAAQVQSQVESQKKFYHGILGITKSPKVMSGSLPVISHTNNVSPLLPDDSTFSRLFRSPSPPQLSTSALGAFVCEKAQEAFETLYDGVIHVRWCATPSSFEIIAYLPNDSRPVMNWRLNNLEPLEVEMDTATNQEYHMLWTVVQKEHLARRVIHRFLREHGADVLMNGMSSLQGGFLSFKELHSLIASLCEYVSKEAVRLGLYEELVDIKIVDADLYLACGQVDPHRVQAVAVALQTCKRHVEAAEIYLELAQGRIESLMEGFQALCRNSAGMAYFRAQDFVKAEEHLVGALRMYDSWEDHDSTGETPRAYVEWEFCKETEVSLCVGDLDGCYRRVQSGVKGEVLKGPVYMTMVESSITFLALMAVSGFSEVSAREKKSAESVVKARYQNPTKALQALVRATRESTMEGFRNKLRDCTAPKYNRKRAFLDAAAQLSRREIQDERKKYFRMIRRDETKSLHAMWKFDVSPLPLYCHGCGGRIINQHGKDNRRWYCKQGCMTVIYCSRECQEDSWPYHQESCTCKYKKKTGRMAFALVVLVLVLVGLFNRLGRVVVGREQFL